MIIEQINELINQILYVMNRFIVPCLILIISALVALLSKLVINRVTKHNKDKEKADLYEKIGGIPKVIMQLGGVGACIAIAYIVYTMWSEIAVAFTNGYLAYGLLFATFAFGAIWKVIIVLFHKKDRVITPIRIILGGIFISAVVYFYPLCREYLMLNNGEGGNYYLAALWSAMQFAFRLFILDGELFWIFDLKDEFGVAIPTLSDPAVMDFYTRIGSVLYVSAPIFTFGFVLTFFKNVFSKIRYSFGVFAPTHVFNELNEKSLALASDLKKNNPFNMIVFTDITDKVEEEKLELVEDAHMLGAILFSKDFDSIVFKRMLSPRRLRFYLISDDEHKKLRHAEVVKKYDYKHVELRLFSPDVRSELMMASSNPKRMRAIRIDDIQTLVYHNLYTQGKMLFERARNVGENQDRVISAVIVGLGQYGREMLKALTWFCQLKGYKIKITAFDTDEKALEKFTFMCPELMSEKYNGKHTKQRIEGEPYYEIDIIGGVDVSTPQFRDKLMEIKDATYIFVCLGTDEINLKTAVEIRSMCESVEYDGDGHKPDIETVIYDSKLANSIRTTWEDIKENVSKNPKERKLSGVTYRGKQAYDILVTGDLDSFYSVSTLIDSDLIDDGLILHLGYSLNFPQKKAKKARLGFKCPAADKSKCEYRRRMIENAMKNNNHFICLNQQTDKCVLPPPPEKKEEKVTENNCRLCKIIAKFDLLKKKSSRSSKKKAKTVEKKCIICQIGETIRLMKEKAAQRECRFCKKKEAKMLKNGVIKPPFFIKKKVPLYIYSKLNHLCLPCMLKAWLSLRKDKNSSERKFWRFEYDFNSSVAKAIHRKLRKEMNLYEDGAENWSELCCCEKIRIANPEHIRWSAYIRSKGFSKTQNYDRDERNDLGKRHNCLIPTYMLNDKELEKD